MEYTKTLAESMAKIRYDDLPAEVVEKAKLCVLDFFANVYGSQALDAVSKMNSYIRSLGGPEKATAFCCGFKTGIHHAAFLNGTAAEAIESQDGLRFGGNHPGTAVIPAAFAVAEELGLSGKEVLAAIVAGYETAGRVAASVHPQHTLSGFLPTGTCGTFGSAVAAGLMMGQDENKLLNTLGNAGYILPISMAETLMGGFTAKIVQGGQAASAGLTAAGMAQAGITGAPYIFEGSHLNGGFAKITSGAMDPNLDRIVDGLGESFSIMDIYFKPYTACRHTHGSAQATLELLASENFAARDVESIDVHTYGIAAIATGKPVNSDSSFVSAQFSIPYVVAACLLDKEMGPAQMKEERIKDPALLALAGKVNIHMDQEINNLYPEHTASRVEIHLKDGRKLSRQINDPKGDPRVQMNADELSAKMRSFAEGFDSEKIENLIESVLNLESIKDISKAPFCA